MTVLIKTGWLVLALALALSTSVVSAAGPTTADLKKLRIARVDPPIKAPNFRLMDLSGKPVSLSDFGDKGVLVYFWASW